MTIEKKSLKVGKYVDTDHVNTVIANYKQTRWVHNSRRIGKEDSMSAWWSIEEIEEFLAHAKDHGANGIRFYFGAYPHDYTGDPNYADRQTIVMAASKQVETESGKVNKDVYINTDKGISILAYNAPLMCPPYGCPRGGGLADSDDWGGIGTTLVDRGDEGMVVV